jgi:peptidoglycan/xylan/chitin deacetylase (PgdA/CDA1 family)
VSILNFHGVGEPAHELSAGEANVWLDAPRFLEILDAVKGVPNVELTFDDGNMSDIEIAVPALFERGLRATFFIVADRIDQEHYLSKADVKALVQAGMPVGSHGKRHVPWRGLDDQRLREELVEAKETIERAVGDAISEAACPFGSYDRRSLLALRSAGFARVYTSDTGPAHADTWLVARNTIACDDTPESVRRIIADPGRSPVRGLKKLIKRWR